MISVFGRFKVDDMRKRIKMYGFLNENELVWTGGNKTKMLMWSKIFKFCFLLVQTKTDTFNNALVSLGPQS